VKLVRGAYHPHEIAAHHAASTERMPPASLDLPNDSKAEEVTSIKAVKRASRSKSPSISPEFLPPVWLSKAETDACYNEAAQLIISRIHEDLTKHKSASHAFRQGGRAPASPPPHVGVLFGTHNWTSCDVILDTLVQYGLASKEPSVSDDGKDGSPTMRETVRIPEDVAEYVTIGQLYGEEAAWWRHCLFLLYRCIGMSNSLTNSLVERTRCTVPFVIKYVITVFTLT
jgi:proline dehydrogenase